MTNNRKSSSRLTHLICICFWIFGGVVLVTGRVSSISKWKFKVKTFRILVGLDLSPKAWTFFAPIRIIEIWESWTVANQTTCLKWDAEEDAATENNNWSNDIVLGDFWSGCGQEPRLLRAAECVRECGTRKVDADGKRTWVSAVASLWGGVVGISWQ